jgi:macrolide transport system ATP-binding/permease protein
MHKPSSLQLKEGFFMLLLEADKIKKLYGDRILFRIDSLKIYQGERIGVVGANGCGKTTLLNILAGIDSPSEGTVRRYSRYAFIHQLEDTETHPVERIMEKRFGVPDLDHKTMSGGERTRLKIARALSDQCPLIFADEPTCNLDLAGIQLLEEELKNFKGALVLVSHDRALLDSLCTRIIEIENGLVTGYTGNFSEYRRQKEAAGKRRLAEYEHYLSEKRRLTAALIEKKQKAGSMKKTPSRMGNSEARLHKGKTGQKMAKLEKAAAAIRTRIEQLEVKEKPAKPIKVNMDIKDQRQLYCRVAVTGKSVSKAFGNKVILKEISFEVPAGKKVALIGNNGSGKTTLLKMIETGEKGIETARGARIGYFHQDLDTLDENKTLLENVMQDSSLPLPDVRLILARLMFRREEVHKKVKVLSGGERVKVALAKIFAGSYNVIVLDEPTNYLDVYSLEALEKVMKEYRGTILFVSHDRTFIEQIADEVIVLQHGKAVHYPGKYSEYLQRLDSFERSGQDQRRIKILQLENKLSEIIGRLCTSKQKDTSTLDTEYKTILKELNLLRSLSK